MKKLAQCYISTMFFSMSFFRLVRKHRDPEAQIRMTTRPNHQGQKKLEERKSGKYNFGVRPKAESETRRSMENIQGSLVCHVDAGVDTLSRECPVKVVSSVHRRRREVTTYGMSASKRFSTDFNTSSSASLLTNEIERPLVPNRPARPTRWR